MHPSSPAPSADKQTLRAWAKTRRAELDMPTLSPVLASQVAALPEFARAGHVLFYLALPGEVNLEALAQDYSNKQFYAPRQASGRRLTVHPYTPGRTPLLRGPLGVREPDPETAPALDPALLELVIVPALLLSEQGDRLGYGGGFYDRFLPTLSVACAHVGVLPEALVVPELPRDPWDVRVPVVVSEEGVRRVTAVTEV